MDSISFSAVSATEHALIEGGIQEPKGLFMDANLDPSLSRIINALGSALIGRLFINYSLLFSDPQYQASSGTNVPPPGQYGPLPPGDQPLAEMPMQYVSKLHYLTL